MLASLELKQTLRVLVGNRVPHVDWKMWALRLTGRLDAELRRHDIEP